MSKLTNFALRMPPEIKEAARVLSQTTFVAPGSKDGLVDHVWLRSINDALCYLLKTGLSETAKILRENLFDANQEHQRLSGIMRFFLDNPAATLVVPANFPKGSGEREIINQWCGDEAHDGIDRSWFTREYAACERRIWGLTESLGAVQRAVASHDGAPAE